MDEVQPNNVMQEVVTQGETNQEQKQVVQETPIVEDKQEKNWRNLRRQNDDLQKQLREQGEILQKFVASQNAPAPVVDELDSIADDEYISKGKVKRVVQKEAEKIAKSIVAEENKKFRQQREVEEFAGRLRKKYSDFDEIVNPETIALLEETNPELARAIASSQDPYSMALQSYEYIKATGISSKTPDARRTKEVERKIEENKNVVQSPLAFDKRPMAQAFKLSGAEKTKLYQEMMGYASMTSGL